MNPKQAEDYLESMFEVMRQRQPELVASLNFEIRLNREIAACMGWTNGQLLTKHKLPLVIDDVIPSKDGKSDIYILDPAYLSQDIK